MRHQLLALLFLLRLASCALVSPLPSTCTPGDVNCVPPSPSSAVVTGTYPIEVTSSLRGTNWKKNPFGAPTTYDVQLAADSAACGTCTDPASIDIDPYGRVIGCTSGTPSPAAGTYYLPQNLVVTDQGTVASVQDALDITVDNVTSTCQSVVGTWTPAQLAYWSTACGWAYINKLFIGNDAGIAQVAVPYANRYGNFLVETNRNTYDSTSGWYSAIVSTVDVLNATGTNPSTFTGYSMQRQVYGSGQSYTDDVSFSSYRSLYGNLNITLLRGVADSVRFQANYTGTVRDYYAVRPDLGIISGAAATVTNYQPFYGATPGTGVTVTNSRVFYCDGTGGGSTSNACFMTTERTGGTKNAAYHINSNANTDGAKLCGGTAFDACIGRVASGVMGLKAGNSFGLDGGGIANVAAYATGGNLRLGSPVGTAKATTDTIGWPLMPSVAGVPTGVPQNETANSAAFTWDRTNKKVCIRDQPTNAWVCFSGTGVSSITGTANQIAASASTGAVTLSIPTNPVLPGYTTTNHYVTTAGTPTCTVLGPAGTGATCSVKGTDSGFVAALNTGTGVTSGATSLRIDYARPFASRPYGISSSVASGTTVTELLTTSPCWTVGPGDVNGFWMFNSCLLADSKTYERTFTVMG